MKQTLKIFAAGCAVYVGMAACSAADTGSQRLAGAGGSSAGPASIGGSAGLSGGTGGGLVDSGLDAIADALTDPVGDADAAPSAVVTAQCDKTFRAAGAGYDTLYAEASFSGATVNDLAAVRVVLNYAEAPQIPGYTAAASIPQLRPGFAAVLCGYDLASSVIPSSVTFILP